MRITKRQGICCLTTKEKGDQETVQQMQIIIAIFRWLGC